MVSFATHHLVKFFDAADLLTNSCIQVAHLNSFFSYELDWMP